MTDPRRVLGRAERLVVLTGAGMSADSGVPTFRDAHTGLWSRFDPTELATPEAWDADPALVWAWYRWRVRLVAAAVPNAGHRAIADAERTRDVVVVTQNVDDLHERAGSRAVHHLHGSLFADRCSGCDRPADDAAGPRTEPVFEEPATERLEPPRCPDCGDRIRPGVVWFGESLPAGPWDAAVTALDDADAVLVVGTSGLVRPAASLPAAAAARGIPVVVVDPGAPDLGLPGDGSVHVRASAAEALPDLLGASGG